jgi:hypothetical protein
MKPQDTKSLVNAHTPAPWFVLADPVWKDKHQARFVATSTDVETFRQEDEKIWRFADHKDSIICTMPDSVNQKANARLIAAAPDLLAACYDLATADSAIIGTEYGNELLGKAVLAARAAIAKAEGES